MANLMQDVPENKRVMLMDPDYEYKGHKNGSRLEDNYLWGYEVCRRSVVPDDTKLIPICLGGYGFADKQAAYDDGKKRVDSFMNIPVEVTYFIRIYRMNTDREIIPATVITLELK